MNSVCAAERQGFHGGDPQASCGKHPQKAGPQDACLPQGRAAAAEATGPRAAAVPGLPAAAAAPPPPAAVPAAAAAATVSAVLRLGCRVQCSAVSSTTPPSVEQRLRHHLTANTTSVGQRL